MTTEKKLGIWMDYSSAHLMEYRTDTAETTTLRSVYSQQERQHSLSRSEHLLHNKEQNMNSEFFKDLGNTIKKFDVVLLFGPTKAKSELLNILKADQRFEKVKILVKDSDKMTDHQQHAFVKSFFTGV